MLGLLPLVAIVTFLPAGEDRRKEQHGIVRVQIEGTFGITSRLQDKEDASTTILAGGGEFLLDFRGCPDGQKRLNNYFKKTSGGPGRVTDDKVKASGQLEFRPEKRVNVESGVPAQLIPVLVVESFSILEAHSK